MGALTILCLVAGPKTEKAYIMAQVVDTSGGVCEINRGTEWGVPEGETVGFYRAWENPKMFAVGVVERVDSFRSFVRPKYNAKPSPGDLVQIKVILPRRGWNTDPLLSLCRLYIRFTDDTGQSIFWPDDALDASPGWRDTVLSEMVASARALAGYTEDITTTGGEALSRLLSATTRDSVLAFLEFVADFPAGYMGVATPFAGAYATWLKQGSPPSGKRLAQMLKEADASGRDALVKKYPKELPGALDWLVRGGDRDLALEIARATGDEDLIKLVREARIK